MNECNILRDFRQTEKRGAAWLDDRTFDRPLTHKDSDSVSMMGAENLSIQIHQTFHRTGNSKIADAHQTWYNTPGPTSNESDITDVAQQIIQDSSRTGYHNTQSSPSPHEAWSIRHYRAPLNADRRLMYIADPDTIYLLALIRTASAYQERSLRDIIGRWTCAVVSSPLLHKMRDLLLSVIGLHLSGLIQLRNYRVHYLMMLQI
jgi:hypothetical protein